MKDMSKVFFMINGYSLKNIKEFTYNKPTDPWTQDDEDIYGEHENVYAASKKIVFEITVRTGTDDDKILKTLEIAKTENVGTMKDSRGKNTNTIAFDKAVVSNLDRTYNRSENTVKYTIKASVVTDVMI